MVARRTPTQVRGPAEHLLTGTGDAPGRSSRLLRPRRPRHLACAAPLRQAGEALCGSSSPTDPALPGGSAWEKFYAPEPQHHKAFGHISFTYFEFLWVLHNTSRLLHRRRPDLHNAAATLWKSCFVG